MTNSHPTYTDSHPYYPTIISAYQQPFLLTLTVVPANHQPFLLTNSNSCLPTAIQADQQSSLITNSHLCLCTINHPCLPEVLPAWQLCLPTVIPAYQQSSLFLLTVKVILDKQQLFLITSSHSCWPTVIPDYQQSSLLTRTYQNCILFFSYQTLCTL